MPTGDRIWKYGLRHFWPHWDHKAQRAMYPAYIAGLIGPGDRHCVQPMAARNGDIPYDRLHHVVSAGVWDSAPLEAALWHHADHLVGGERS